MKFTLASQLSLPCSIERIVPGALHADGRRYLPLIVLRLEHAPDNTVTQVAVVDRHHRVDPTHAGRRGSARLVFLLSQIRLLDRPRAGLFDPAASGGRASTMPEACGQVLAVPTWEQSAGHLPYETLYTELLLDIGAGVVGVRTSATAESLEQQLGAAQIAPGDWIKVTRSRIDILSFEAAEPGAP